MSAKKDAPQGQTDVQEAHYHVLGSGRQFLVVRHSHAWRPPTDVIEESGALRVMVEIAGMQEGDFSVTVNQRHLTISGVRPSPSRGHEVAYHQIEVRHGEFRTDVMLPWPVEEEDISARYSDGFLHVELPRAQPQRVRVVKVDKDEGEEAA